MTGQIEGILALILMPSQAGLHDIRDVRAVEHCHGIWHFGEDGQIFHLWENHLMAALRASVWVGPSALIRLVIRFLGRCPRLGWQRAVGA